MGSLSHNSHDSRWRCGLPHMMWRPWSTVFCQIYPTGPRRGSRIVLQGGGGGAVYSGRPRRPGGLGLINIRLRYIASIEYSERSFFFFAIVKKFVEKENWWSRAGGVTTPPPGYAPEGRYHGVHNLL